MNWTKTPISKIKRNPNNPRVIKDGKFEKLVKSIRDFPEMLEIRPIVVNADMIVLGGNMRLKACKEAGLKEIPVIQAAELTEAQQREFIIKDNVGFGEWDWELIANEWDADELQDWGLDLPGFENVEEIEPKDDNYEMPDEVHTDIVPGDLFEIGPHRLLCGESTDSDQVAKLLNGETPDLVFTDPPYGIEAVGGVGKVGGGSIVKSKIYSKVIGDETTDTARDFYATCLALGMKNFIIWGGNYFTDFVPPSRCWLVWDKENSGNFADFEMAWTSFDKSARLYKWLWNGLARKGNHRQEGKTRLHPTQKPVGLAMQIFADFSFKLCYDGFLGSGFAMVASHEMGRKCYGVEIDPKYCQIIIDRMLKLDPALTVKKNGELTRITK